MKSTRLLPVVVILLALLACAVPQGPESASGAPTPSPLPVITATPIVRPTATSSSSIATPWPSPTPRPRQHRIGIRRVYGLGELYDQVSGTRFTPRGVFYENVIAGYGGYQDRLFGVGIYDSAQVQADFERLSSAGYNTVRLRLDGCTRGPECLFSEGGTLNPGYLDNIADLMRQAQAQNLVLLVASAGPQNYTAASQPSENSPGENSPGEGSPFAEGRNAQILSMEGVEASQAYWNDLMAGLAGRGVPFEQVLGWEILEEFWVSVDQPPFTLTGTLSAAHGLEYDMSDPLQVQQYTADATRFYIEQVRQVIQGYDPGALIGMGFLRPDFPNPARFNDYRYTDTASLLETAALDFFDLHISPGGDLDLGQAIQNFGLNTQNTRPVLLGRVGASLDRYPNALSAAEAVQEWAAGFCPVGVDGWMYASYQRPPENLSGGVWGFADAGAYLLEALAPLRQPDACTVGQLPSTNLAYRRPVSASAELAGASAEQAVDGGPAFWSPGAPPPQWLEVDLGAPSSVARLRLVPAPPAPPEDYAGSSAAPQSTDNLHQVWVAGEDGKLRLEYTFTDLPPENGIFEVIFSPPLAEVQYISIYSQQEGFMGWQEVEIYSP